MKEFDVRKMLESIIKLLESAETQDFENSTYKVIEGWDIETGPEFNDPSSGSYVFKKKILTGSTIIDIDVEIDDNQVHINECAEMFKVDIYQVVHFYVSDDGEIKIGVNSDETKIVQEQEGYEDIDYDGNYKIEDVEKALLNLPEGDAFDTIIVVNQRAESYYEDK